MNETIDRRIADLEKELAGLRRQKLAELQNQVAALQASISSGGSAPAGRAAAAPVSAPRKPGRPPKASKGWAATIQAETTSTDATGRKRRGRKRGKHIADNDALSLITKVVAGAGADGISARKASQLSGIFYPRAIKLMDENFQKTGSGKWTRYTA